VAAVLDFDGEWPETGGVSSGQISIAELIKLGQKLRGEPTECAVSDDLEQLPSSQTIRRF
jgi:hypothetical protein